MSFWAKVETKITDLECFKQSCRKNDIDYVVNEDKNLTTQGFPVIATLHDKRQSNMYRKHAYLVQREGAISLIWDNDANYASLCSRLGKNGGKVMRDYAVDVVSKGAMRAGGLVSSTQEAADGTITLKLAMM